MNQLIIASALSPRPSSQGRDRLLSLLRRPITYGIAVPVLSALGAGTTVLMPVLLAPAEFGRYALLLSVLQYVYEFDFGLSRLSDRLLTQDGVDVDGVTSDMLMSRLYVAGVIALAALAVGYLLDGLAALAILAGGAGMISNGPIAVYRARSRMASFTVAAIATQFGLSLPRLAGVLLDGVRGGLAAFLLWYGTAAVILYLPFLARLRRPGVAELARVFRASWPLFILSFSWLMYLLSSRWLSWLISTPEQAGLFAFGVNFLLIGVAVISVVAQAYYPRHLVAADRSSLHRELRLLLVLATIGCVLADGFCRWWLGAVFPGFAQAASSTAASLFAGIPLSLCAWLVPLVIARSMRPMREAIVLFGGSVAALCAAMLIGNDLGGIEGQAWVCVASPLALLAMLLSLTVRARLAERQFALHLWLACLGFVILSAGVWYGSFRHV